MDGHETVVQVFVALKKQHLAILVAALALALFGGLLLSSRGDERGATSDVATADEPEAQATVTASLTPPPDVKNVPSAAPRASVEHSPNDNVVGPGPDDPHEPGMLPHPMDEARARLQRENSLILSLNDAMAGRQVQAMRKLLVEYRALDPSDVEATQAGYEVIADCIEFPGDASLTAARKFYDSERHSPLRRFVRRICFENGN